MKKTNNIISLNSVDDIKKNEKKIKLYTEKDNSFIILVHATWCGHCRKMIPIWDSVKNNKSIPIFEIEDSAMKHILSNKEYENSLLNTILDNVVRYYPTLLFVDSRDDNIGYYVMDDVKNEKNLKSFLTMGDSINKKQSTRKKNY